MTNQRRIAVVMVWMCCIAQAVWGIGKDEMQRIYEEVRTPYKYGMVVAPSDNYHKIDCPTVFREGNCWYMTYVVYNGKDGLDGRGYETWLASSDNLLEWTTIGRILSFRNDTTLWDGNQRGGFPALIDWTWNGTYQMQKYKGKHWMTYIGGHGTGYEAVREPLHIGLAWTKNDITQAHEWESNADHPLLSCQDSSAQWWEKLTEYKSTIYSDTKKTLGKRFVMFYNAGGVHPETKLKAERIGIALSDDMLHWSRYQGNPVFSHEAPGIITGDAQIVKMVLSEPLYVMFYFSAYNPSRKYDAYNTFSVSRDLIHWQDWDGEDLITPSKSYDNLFAHKSYVLKHDGVVYHFYCAVNKAGQRGIAVATSVPMGRSKVAFPMPEKKGKRTITLLNDDWTARCSVGRDTLPMRVNLPHNFDDYYGYRQLRHGNLHGSAIYNKVFQAQKQHGKRYFLQLEGVGTYATITLNGVRYPKELVGRTVFTLDVTDALHNGDNQLQVEVDHPAMQTASPWVCGGCSSEWGFSEGSQPFGIFRPVSLIETDGVRIEPFGVHVWNNAACDSLFVEAEVHNYTDEPQQIELVNKFALASGKQVFRHSVPLTLQAGEVRVLRHAEKLDHPTRWSVENPYLYTLTTMVKRGGKTTDEVATPVGVRSVSWPVLRQKAQSAAGDRRFFLNDKPLFINGTCEYEHLLGGSHAFSDEQIRSRVKQIRNAGFNAFREAHQPHNLLYQQLFDEQGMLFWSQFSAHIWYDTPAFRENFKRLLTRWVKERRNSPSIILWGLQNESILPKDFAEECSELIRQLDPTCCDQRAITTCNGGEGTDWNVIQNWSGTYGGTADNYDKELKQDDQLLNGEYGAWRTLDLHGDEKYSEESSTKLLETKQRLAWSAQDSVCGHFQWLFSSHDNPGRVQPDGAYRRIDKIGPINYKGLTTIWEEPTQGYYMYRNFANKPDSRPLAPSPKGNGEILEGGNETYLYRINCGGDAYTDTFGNQWLADDTLYSHSWGQDFEGINPYQASQRHSAEPVRGTANAELFQFFRFGRHRLWYDFPVPDGDYRVEVYTFEPWHGKGGGEKDDYEGMRIFDVAVNGTVIANDVDPWAEAGYRGAVKLTGTCHVTGGNIRVSFPEVKAGQAIVCAIAIASLSNPSSLNSQLSSLNSHLSNREALLPSEATKRTLNSHPSFWHSLDADTIAKLPKELLPKDTEVRPATVYTPTPLKAGQGYSFQIKPGLGQEYALRFKYKNVTGNPVCARLTVTDSKRAVLVDRFVNFPPTPPKFKMLSTTTGTQINAGTYSVRIEAEGVEIKELEIQ